MTRNTGPAVWHTVALNCLALTGGMLLVAAGVLLWLSAQPAMSGGIRPMFLH